MIMMENSFTGWIVCKYPYSVRGVFSLSNAEEALGEMAMYHLEGELPLEQ